jgi:hypothetical protein
VARARSQTVFCRSGQVHTRAHLPRRYINQSALGPLETEGVRPD